MILKSNHIDRVVDICLKKAKYHIFQIHVLTEGDLLDSVKHTFEKLDKDSKGNEVVFFIDDALSYKKVKAIISTSLMECLHYDAAGHLAHQIRTKIRTKMSSPYITVENWLVPKNAITGTYYSVIAILPKYW